MFNFDEESKCGNVPWVSSFLASISINTSVTKGIFSIVNLYAIFSTVNLYARVLVEESRD